MTGIPDPRRYGTFVPDDPLGALIERHAAGDYAARRELLDWLKECLEQERDADIFQTLMRIPNYAAYSAFWDLVCLAAESGGSGSAQADVALRLFAFPVILVTGARAATTISGTLSDIGAVGALFERHGAVGATRNFG